MAIFTCYFGLAPQGLFFNKDSIGTTRKTASGNYSKKYERDPTVGSKFMVLFSSYSGLAQHDILFNK
jgi:hypothetical protein